MRELLWWMRARYALTGAVAFPFPAPPAPTPPTEDALLTEAGDTLVTEAGDRIVLES